jgi:hypothetical protein
MDGEIKVIVALAAANQKMARYGDLERASGNIVLMAFKIPDFSA